MGLDTLVFERSPYAGGGVLSIRDDQGNVFDKGYHSLDYGRSEVTTAYFQRLLHGNVRKMELRRGIVLEDELFDYNLPSEAWPETLQRFFDTPLKADGVGENQSRDELASVYGKAFTDFAYDEILASYPSKVWAIENGGNPADHIDYVYPWFFPRTARRNKRETETHAYHDKMREVKQEILYPVSGGFGAFVSAAEKDIDTRFCEIRTGVGNVNLKFVPGSRHIEGIAVGDELVTANHYFWCAPLPPLLKAMDIGFTAGPPQRLVLGNFAFTETLESEYHEILVGSRAHLINRIGFPGRLSGGRNNLLQVEFYFPEGEFSLDGDFWESTWMASLEKLGLVETGRSAHSFQLVTEIRGVVSTRRYQTLSSECEQALSSMDTNMIVPFFNLGPENINRVVPGVMQGVVEAVAGTGRKFR